MGKESGKEGERGWEKREWEGGRDRMGEKRVGGREREDGRKESGREGETRACLGQKSKIASFSFLVCESKTVISLLSSKMSERSLFETSFDGEK